MDTDSEDESEKTYTNLENLDVNYQLQFEKYIIGEESDNEYQPDLDENFELEQNDENEEDTENIEDENESNIEIIESASAKYEPASTQEFTLKSEELEVIESCHHEKLKELLYLNRSKNFMLMQLYKKVKDSLRDCKNEINSLTSIVIPKRPEKPSLVLTHLGAPYFKTKINMFSCDLNADALDRRKKGILSIYNSVSVPKWSKEECQNLIVAVKLNYNHNRQKKVINDLRLEKFGLQCCSDEGAREKVLVKIAALESDLKNLESVSSEEIPKIFSDEFLDWDHISTKYLKDKHNPSECRSFWHLYLHPEINKGNWTKQENEKIKELAEKYKRQNWELIAEELGTKRSGFSVCVHYFSALYNGFSKERFSKEEDVKLLSSIERLKIGSFIPWAAVAEEFQNRSKQQLIHRYRYFLLAADSDRSAFTDAEDVLLLILVRRYGHSYSLFTSHFPNRSYLKIKHRYGSQLSNVRPDRAAFTLTDDRKIVDYFEGLCDDKTMTLQRLSFELGREKMKLRQRYKTLKVFLAKNKDKELKDAPRRMTGRLDAFQRLEFLKYIADQYAHAPDIPTLDEIQKHFGCQKKRGRKRKYEDSFSVDNLLVNFFSHSYKLKRKPLELNGKKLDETSNHMFDILKKWKCQLDIPVNLEKSKDLDAIDLELLDRLREKFVGNREDISAPVEHLIPPNINTMLGLRALLFKNKLHQRKTKDRDSLIKLIDDLPLVRNKLDENIARKIMETLKNLTPERRNRVEDECCIFLERFISLFLWPAVFSLESPEETLLEAEMCVEKVKNVKKTKTKREKKVKEVVPRKTKAKKVEKTEEVGVKRSLRLKEKRENEEIVEKKKILVKSETLKEVPENLRPVDKKEVELMIKNSKKPVMMYKIQKVKMPDGTIKTITKLIEKDKIPIKLKEKPTIIKNNESSSTIVNLENTIENSESATVNIVKNKSGSSKVDFSDNLDILKIVSLANSVKKEKEFCSDDVKEVSEVIKKNIKQYSVKLSKKLNVSNKIITNEKEDVDKLNDFLENCGNNDELIDLTEDEITRNDVQMLDDLIKSENNV